MRIHPILVCDTGHGGSRASCVRGPCLHGEVLAVKPSPNDSGEVRFAGWWLGADLFKMGPSSEIGRLVLVRNKVLKEPEKSIYIIIKKW